MPKRGDQRALVEIGEQEELVHALELQDLVQKRGPR